MDDQAKVKNDSTNGSAESMVGSIAGFGNDVATLAELQLKLAALDFKETSARALVPLALVVVALVVILGSVPVAIGGVALLIAQVTQLSIGGALLVTAIVTLGLASVVVVVAGRKLGASLEGFQRSRDELIRNISWIRTVLVYSGRAVPKRRW
ncbi:Putative Holin-X, holin superfamily III [Singulisphaera sp. GP187]|uniref:phage holin family protein n=1 Tax=Singulisphaera sp. GP187 TaxID=1882752 RepID=UPI00092C569B|nr:phage holin family protein [Singulisphaera sp. GP187]SIO66757.1 Putative Holin-X, holin superfamily III [Singulisphaera sp. GP187]